MLGLLYVPHYPNRTYDTARAVRRSPLHDRLVNAGACMADLNGWERPMFFARPELGVEAVHHDGWGIGPWHEANALEHRAVREQVGLFDPTSFAKIAVQGADAGSILDQLSAGAVNGPVGASVYTQWLYVPTEFAVSVFENLIAAGADARLLHHNEPLYRDGECVDSVTGGMWGHTVDAAIGMALAVRGEKVTKDWVDSGSWTIELPGVMMPAEVQLGPWLR